MPVLLFSWGQNQINPAGEAIYERVAFSDFAPNSAISGGLLEIEGQILPYDRGPLIIELITEAGKSLSLRVVNVSGSDWQAVKTSLPYRVSTTTPARLYVHQTDDLLGGEGYVFSQALTLKP